MKEIITAIGTAITVNKAINVMTETNEANPPRNVWFRIFRAVFWLSLGLVCVSGALWVAAKTVSAMKAML